MRFKLILSLGFTVAALCLNAQEVPKSKAKLATKVNKKYLKNIQDITRSYQKNIQFAKEHNQKPPDEYYLQELISTMVPETGQIPNQNYVELNKRIESGRFRPEKNMKLFAGSVNGGTQSKNITNMWVERGPYEVGGRVRGIMFDPNDPTGKKVWAGGVSGGLWYNNDITNANSEWTLVDGF